MRKKTYQQPKTETTNMALAQLIASSPDWTQDGGDITVVDQEGDDWWEEIQDSIGGSGGFIEAD